MPQSYTGQRLAANVHSMCKTGAKSVTNVWEDVYRVYSMCIANG